MSALVVSDLSRSFGGVLALDGVSFEVPQGERRAFIGTNGAGKTTLFNTINGQIAPSTGRIALFGDDVTTWPVHRRAGRGLARTFQITNLFPRLSVFENMLIAVQALAPCHFALHARVERFPEIRETASRMLADWGLWDLRNALVQDLAYGLQRKLEMVLALSGKPRLLLLDEPMAGLSSSETQAAVDFILGLDRSITILIIEHDLTAAFRIADRVTAMDQGKIIAQGTPAEIREDPLLRKIYLRPAVRRGQSGA